MLETTILTKSEYVTTLLYSIGYDNNTKQLYIQIEITLKILFFNIDIIVFPLFFLQKNDKTSKPWKCFSIRNIQVIKLYIKNILPAIFCYLTLQFNINTLVSYLQYHLFKKPPFLAFLFSLYLRVDITYNNKNKNSNRYDIFIQYYTLFINIKYFMYDIQTNSFFSVFFFIFSISQSRNIFTSPNHAVKISWHGFK